MIKKNGFTLVELLAVIVILAIILVIAVPTTAGIIRNSTKKAFHSDAKMVLKAIEYKKLKNTDFNPLEITKGNMKSILGISDDNYRQINFSIANEVVEVEIVGQNKWDGLVAYGTARDMKVVGLEDYNIVLPSITIIGDNPVEIGRGSTYIDAGATAEDIEEGELLLLSIVIRDETGVVVEDIDTSFLGTYTITYTAVNSKGHESSSVRRISVVDKTAPVITLIGAEQIFISRGTAYSDPGVTALDDIDGDITNNVIKTGTVNPSVLGTYIITYNVSDSAGNASIEVTRTVNVVDAESPIITILGNNPVNIYVGSTYSDAGAMAIDNEDGDVTSSIVTTGIVNPNVVGTYTITYTVSDSSGNESIATRTVNVIDITLPTVVFGTNGNSTYSKSRNTTVTVSDVHSGVDANSLKYQWTTSTATPPEGTFTNSFTNGGVINSPLGVSGTYYLWILAKDTSGNTIITRSNLFNLDNTIPSVTGITFSTSNVAGTTFTINRSGNASDAHGGLSANPYVYQISTDGTSWTTKCTNNATVCDITGLTTNTLYYYRICVNDVAGNQACTNSNTITPVDNYFCGPLLGNAEPAEVLSGKTYYNQSGYKAGTMINRGAIVYTPSTSNQTIGAGYHNGSGFVKGDPNLTSGNIKKGTTIFNILGTYEGFAKVEQGNVASLSGNHCSSSGWGSASIPLNFMPDIVTIKVETISSGCSLFNYADMYWNGKKSITSTQRSMFISDVTETGFKINVSSHCGADTYPCTWTNINWLAIKF